jgi:hypothetical protein
MDDVDERGISVTECATVVVMVLLAAVLSTVVLSDR